MVISLTQPTEPTGTLKLTTDTVKLSPEVTEEKIQHARYGLVGKVPTDTVAADFWTGHERRLREYAADYLSMREYQDRLSYISEVSRMAAAEGRPLSEAEQALILSQEVPRKNPNTILEEVYAQRFVDDLADDDGVSYQEAEEEDPERAAQVRSIAEEIVTKQEIARRILQEAQAKFETRGLPGQVWDFARGLIPGYSWWQQHGRLGEAGSGEIFLGEHRQAQITGLYSLPVDEFEARLQEAVYSLANENTLEALSLAAATVAYSGSDALWDNVFTGLDIADVATIGVSTAAGVIGYANRVRKATATAAQTGSTSARQVAQNQVIAAAQSQARARLQTMGAASRVDQQIQEIQQIVPDLLNGERFFSDPGSLSAEATRRQLEILSNNRQLLVGSLDELPVVNRVPDDVRERAFAETEHLVLNRLYPNLEDSVVNINRKYEASEVFGGADHIEVYLGNKDAQGFTRQSQAEFFANRMYKLPEGGYDIVNEGGGWYIRLTKNVDETSLTVQDLRVDTKYRDDPNVYNVFLALLDSSNNQLSQAHNAVRSLATYGGEAMFQRLRQAAEPIGQLSKNELRRLTEVMDAARFKNQTVVLPDGTQTQVPGKFFDTVFELEAEYLSRFNRNPTEKEVAAYQTFRQLMDYEYLQLNAEVYRDLARQGVEQYAIQAMIPNAEDKLRFGTSAFTNARLVDRLPDLSQGGYSVAWVDSATGKQGFGLAGRMGSPTKEGSQAYILQNLVNSGDYKILQVVNKYDESLSRIFDTGGEPLDFVVVKNVKTRPLNFQQVPYREGGHLIYPSTGQFIKQTRSRKTKFGRRVIDGDTTALYVQTTAEAKVFEEAFNTARRMLQEVRAGLLQRSVLEDYLSKNLPFRSVKEFDAKFKDGTFDIDTPFVATGSGQRASDVLPLNTVFSEELVDGSAHNIYGSITSRFTQERNERLLSPVRRGTMSNPVYNFRPAPVLNSMEALRRSASDAARSRFFSDYKHREVENWASRFGQYLDAPIEKVKGNPIQFLKNPVFRDGTPWDIRQAAMTVRRNILTLLQQYSTSDNAFRWMKQKLADGVYQLGGNRAVDMIEPILWDAKTDPVAAIRGWAFDAKLGLFNVIQLPLQASAATMAMAIDGSPIRSVQAVLAYPLLRARLLAEGAPQIQKAFTQKFAKALGLDEDTLDEMYTLWRNTGFDHTGGSFTYLNDYLNPSDLTSETINKARDVSRFFFREGNNIHKSTSFILSYLRWRQANPGKRLTNQATEQIVSRANTYYLNMSRNSDAAWQHPKNWLAQIAVLPMQFWAFQHRLMSMMFGKELSGLERARLLAMNSLLWGVPVGGAGTAVGLFGPIGEGIRGWAIDNGYNPETADTVSRIIMDGVVDLGVENILGSDYNVSERFGPGGLEWSKQLLEGEIREVLGAAPNFVLNVIEQTEPITRGIISIFRNDDDSYFSVVKDDVIAALREVSSINNTTRALLVYETGLWLTRKEGLIATYDAGDPMLAIAAALSLSPQEIADTYIRMDSVNSRDEAKRQIINQAIIYFERGLRAYKDRNKEQGDQFFKYAYIMMQGSGLTPLERQEAWSRAVRSNQSLVEQIEQRWIMQDFQNRYQTMN